MDFDHNPLIKKIINDLIERYSDNIISIYGIGSYFDEDLPSDWIKNDLDLVAIVKDLSKIPKEDWTDIPFEKYYINGNEVWVGFNTLEGFRNKEKFKSFSNYEWSVIDFIVHENSSLLFGLDIRDQLPDINSLVFNLDNLLARSLYHIENSLKPQIQNSKVSKSQRAFTKAVFKFGFYLCRVFDKDFYLTSIHKIAVKVEA